MPMDRTEIADEIIFFGLQGLPARILMCFLSLQACAAWAHVSQEGPPPNAARSSDTYSDLTRQSAALPPEQKAKARELFSTGFTLWQSGDFAAATIAFQTGLDIDPANGVANYYLGDCFRRAKQRQEAMEFLTRASVLGAGSPESFKAAAALKELAKPPVVEEMSPEQLKELYIGTWAMEGNSKFKFTISHDDNGVLSIKGTAGSCFLGCAHYKKISADGKSIQFTVDNDWFYTFRLTGPNRFEGDARGPVNHTTFAIRQQ